MEMATAPSREYAIASPRDDSRMDVTPVDGADGVFYLAPPPPRIPAVLSMWHAMITRGTSAPVERKRSFSTAAKSRSGDDPGHGSSDSDDKKSKKKPTYVARKEEKALLEKEIAELEARAHELRKTAGISGLSAASAQLRDGVDYQRVVLACAQSVFSEYTMSQQSSPLESFIHLTKDWRQRQATLIALRGPKTETARRFLAARMKFINPTKPSSEMSKFQQDDGSFCSVKLSVTPFRGLKSAKQVYDALMFYFFNIEISISEITGSTTVNENHTEAEKNKAGVLCHRLVTDVDGGLSVEKNSIQFLSYQSKVTSSASTSLGGDEYAFMTSDFANIDDLYPYCPETRLRKDITTALRISSHQEQGEDGEFDLVVVLTYWMYIKTHASKLKDRKLTLTELERVHDGLVYTMEALPMSIRQTLYGA